MDVRREMHFVSDEVLNATQKALDVVGVDPRGTEDFYRELVRLGYEVRRIRTRRPSKE